VDRVAHGASPTVVARVLGVVEVWTPTGLVTYYLLFAIQHSTRAVHFVGCTVHPDAAWMEQLARNLTDALDGFLLGTRYLLIDRDTKFCDSFRRILRQACVICLRLPPRSPNPTPTIERFMRSLQSESLDRLILFSEASLRSATRSFLAHYHGERNHQGLDHRSIEPDEELGRTAGRIACRQRLSGMLKYYYRQAG
jgi:putative transposase